MMYLKFIGEVVANLPWCYLSQRSELESSSFQSSLKGIDGEEFPWLLADSLMANLSCNGEALASSTFNLSPRGQLKSNTSTVLSLKAKPFDCRLFSFVRFP